MKKRSIIFIFLILILFGVLYFKTDKKEQDNNLLKNEEKYEIINPEGNTVETRIAVPLGFKRMDTGDFGRFLREYPVKEDKSQVLLYNGEKKRNQKAHAAVLNLPIEPENLQQCADSVMRIYAEYFWQKGEYEKIAFHFTDGFLAEYSKWRDGFRIKIEGNKESWIQSKEPDSSYECFQSFMRLVFSYAGTLSMENEAQKIEFSQIAPGDVFLQGGSPGHVVMVLDICENENGKKAILLAQGYMPAQEFHILKNPGHGDDPWYYEDEITYPLKTPEYTFEKGSLKHLCYLD